MTTRPTTVPMSKVDAMLENCAPGLCRRRSTNQLDLLTLNGRSSCIPAGNRMVEVRHVIKTVSSLGIDRECALQHFPNVPFRKDLPKEDQ